jgi:hypothetical protein
MMTRLGKDDFCTASNNGLWAILQTPTGQAVVTRMIEEMGPHFIQISKGGFWSKLQKQPDKFEKHMREFIDMFGLPTLARVIQCCASRFCDDNYRRVLFDALALSPRGGNMITYCQELGARLVQLENFAPVYAANAHFWPVTALRRLRDAVKPDDTKTPQPKVAAHVWEAIVAPAVEQS